MLLFVSKELYDIGELTVFCYHLGFKRMSNFGKSALTEELFLYLRGQGVTISYETVGKLYDHMFSLMCQKVNDGYTVTLGKLGSLKAVDAAARRGYVPSTGKRISIPAMRRSKFSASTAFTTAINTDGVLRKQLSRKGHTK